jgi:hypothetical protein
MEARPVTKWTLVTEESLAEALHDIGVCPAMGTLCDAVHGETARAILAAHPREVSEAMAEVFFALSDYYVHGIGASRLERAALALNDLIGRACSGSPGVSRTKETPDD